MTPANIKAAGALTLAAPVKAAGLLGASVGVTAALLAVTAVELSRGARGLAAGTAGLCMGMDEEALAVTYDDTGATSVGASGAREMAAGAPGTDAAGVRCAAGAAGAV